jgi:hypothetical protein
MEIRFVAPTLSSLDVLKTELLCLTVFRDERPLRGVAGLVDWRLCGRLSSLLVAGKLDGEFDDALLMPPPERRLAAERLLCLGAGLRASVDLVRLRTYLRALVTRALQLRVRTLALELSHASVSAIPHEQAIDVLLEESVPFGDRVDEIVLLEGGEAQKRMEPRIERMRRRALLDV